MPDFWEFPTVSMGLGPLGAIYQARMNRYMEARGIADTSKSHVWAFLGDGEMDEPESLGQLSIAAREGLDNLTFVVNCNLQRLDGPVRGNGKIIQELESQFRGAGWNVIKLVWDRAWDPLLAQDRDGVLVNRLNTTPGRPVPDVRHRDRRVHPRALLRRRPAAARDGREHDRRPDPAPGPRRPRPQEDLRGVRGGHGAQGPADGDPRPDGQGLDARPELRGPQRHPPDEEADGRRPQGLPRPAAPADPGQASWRTALPPYYHPGRDSEEIQYMHDRRKALGGYVPTRVVRAKPLPLPDDKTYAAVKKGSGQQSIATTMAFVRLLKDLMRDKEIGKRFVPIAPDEYRTFGMDSFFPSAKIYNPLGQQYEAVDRDLLLAYKESPTGQMLHDGISEAGCTASLIAAGSAYATHGEPLIPVYVFYSMFGFQRTGDQFWQMADQLARGFVLGATAGRTTLTGEGLQHADGHSQLLASTNPGCVAYDPAFGYEIAHIVKDGLRRMYGGPEHPHGEDVFYYLTVYNEPIQHPAEPADVDVEGILKGIHRFKAGEAGADPGADPGLRRRRCRGRSRRSGSSPRSGTSGPTSGRRPPGTSCAARPWRCERAQPAAPGGGAARPVRDAEAGRRARARSSRSPTGCARSRTRSRAGCPARTSRWARTASASRTRVARPAATSTSTPQSIVLAVLTELAQGGQGRPLGAEAGDRPLPAAGRGGGGPGRGGRRRVSRLRAGAAAGPVGRGHRSRPSPPLGEARSLRCGHEGTNRRSCAGKQRTQRPLLALAVAFAVAYAVPIVAPGRGPPGARSLCTVVEWAVWGGVRRRLPGAAGAGAGQAAEFVRSIWLDLLRGAAAAGAAAAAAAGGGHAAAGRAAGADGPADHG